jgi:hypothetical protein
MEAKPPYPDWVNLTPPGMGAGCAKRKYNGVKVYDQAIRLAKIDMLNKNRSVIYEKVKMKTSTVNGEKTKDTFDRYIEATAMGGGGMIQIVNSWVNPDGSEICILVSKR